MMKCEEGWCQDAVDQGEFPVAAETSSHKETLIHTMFLQHILKLLQRCPVSLNEFPLLIEFWLLCMSHLGICELIIPSVNTAHMIQGKNTHTHSRLWLLEGCC